MSSTQDKFRVEKDTLGEIQVPSDRYWGAQTQRYGIVFRKISSPFILLQPT